MSWIAVGIGGTMLVGSLMESSDENDAMEDKARAFGVRKAGIEAATEQSVSALLMSAKGVQEARAQAGHQIEQGQATAEAQARVNAATAGVAGTSVEQVITQTKVNAGKAQNQVERQKKDANEKAQESLVNQIINSETKVGTLDTSTTDQTAKHIMAFGSGFLGGL